MPGVNLAFFSLAGASLKLDALGHTAWLASVFCAVRLIAIYVGSYVGCWVSECPPEQRKRMWQSMLTQVRSRAFFSMAAYPVPELFRENCYYLSTVRT
jgi:bacteriorhodopsin